MPPSNDAAGRADDLVDLLDRESHLAVVHSGLVLCRQQQLDCVAWREICAHDANLSPTSVQCVWAELVLKDVHVHDRICLRDRLGTCARGTPERIWLHNIAARRGAPPERSKPTERTPFHSAWSLSSGFAKRQQVRPFSDDWGA